LIKVNDTFNHGWIQWGGMESEENPMAGQRTVTFSTVPDVKTVEDLFAIATAMEREAATRYADLAGRMERQGNGLLAALFRRLEKEESGHEDGLGAWASRRGIVPSPPFHFSWDMPETLTEQQFAEAGGDFLATPWRVLVVAAGNEERAFAFYANIAAKTSDSDVRTYAEAMAREELDHVALLRLERRRAWRREHPDPAAGKSGRGASRQPWRLRAPLPRRGLGHRGPVAECGAGGGRGRRCRHGRPVSRLDR